MIVIFLLLQFTLPKVTLYCDESVKPTLNSPSSTAEKGEPGKPGATGPAGASGVCTYVQALVTNILPSRDNVYSLGNTTFRWKEL